tara:strand:+ start:52 stop:519 length:468 start_codon:yes stop_codon:yes gene_type:complete
MEEQKETTKEETPKEETKEELKVEKAEVPKEEIKEPPKIEEVKETPKEEPQNELYILIALGVITTLIIGLVLNPFSTSMKFTWAYLFMFYLPALPYTYNLKDSLLEKFIITNALGLAGIPLFLAFIGVFINLNLAIFLIVPILVFISGIYYQKKK